MVVVVGVGVIAMHAQQNATLKSYYQTEKGRFWQTCSSGGGGHMFSASQVVIINHHQEKPVREK